MASVQTITRSVTIAPGESFTLPNGATVISLTDVVSSTCNLTLPDPEPLVTYKYEFSLNQDDSDEHPMGSEVDIESMLIEGGEVILNFTHLNTDSTGNSAGVTVWNNEVNTNNVLLSAYPVKFISINFSTGVAGNTSKSDLVTVYLKMPESYLNKVFLKVRNDKFPNGLYLKGTL